MEFSEARQIMRETFERDEDLRRVYRDNIAMRLHDHHGITDYDKRNAAAEDLIDLIWFS